MKKIIVVLVFLITGIAFAQTTVTLEDQCNCEVLSGVDVTTAGLTTPTGADTGDIYVNTNTGTIYFWDGDSWELTASDDQQIQNFSFDGATQGLTLTLEDGGSITVDLSSLNNAGTDSQTLVTDGNPGNIEITNGNIVNINVDDADSSITNEVNTRFAVVGANLEIEDGNSTLTVPLSTIGSDDQTITDFSYSDITRVLTLTLEDGNTTTVDLSDLSETIVAGTGAITVNDDGNGNYTINSIDPDESITNEINTRFEVVGANLEIEDDNGTLTVPLGSIGSDNQTLTTDGNPGNISITGGNTVNISVDDADSDPVNEIELPVGGTNGQVLSTDGSGTYTWINDNGGADTQDLSIDAAGTTISLVDGGNVTINANDADSVIGNEYNTGVSFDGTNLVVTDGGGNQSVDISGLDTDNQNLTGASLDGSNVLQIDIENGTSTTVDLSALNNTGTDDQNIESLGVNTTTNVLTVGIEDGTSQTVDLSHLDDNGTDDQTAAEVSYDNTTSGLTATDTQAAIDELSQRGVRTIGIRTSSGSGLSGTDELTIGIENGTNR